MTAARFLAFGAALDFPDADAARAFASTYHSINAVLDPVAPSGDRKAAFDGLAEYLKTSGATLSFHVLVSKELASYVKNKIARETCTAEKLDGCRKAFDLLFAVTQDLGTLPGDDEKLEQCVGSAATWGLYNASYSENAVLPD